MLRGDPLCHGKFTVKSPTLERWLVITLTLMSAEPDAPTLRVFPVMLQLVPEVPVCPVVDIVRCCANPDVTNNEKNTTAFINAVVREAFLKFIFIYNYSINNYWAKIEITLIKKIISSTGKTRYMKNNTLKSI